MLKIIQKYLAANFISPFILSTIFFVVFLLTFQLFRITRIVINKGVSLDIVFELVVHIAVSFLPMAIPLSALFAALYTLNKMSEDSEIVAMRSFGMSSFQLFLPFLIMGIFLSISIFMLNINLIPLSKTKFKNTIIKLTSRGMLTSVKAGNFFTDIPGVTLFAEKVEDGGRKLHDVYINRVGTHNSEESVILARHGTLIKKSTGEWGVPTLRLHLESGNILKKDHEHNMVEKVLFKEYDFPIIVGGVLNTLVSKASMKSNNELKRSIMKEDERLKAIKLKKIKLTSSDLKNLIKMKLEYWSRFNTPIQCLVFIFLGFGLGIKKGRGRGKNTGVAGILVLIGYYILFFVGVSLSRKGFLPPVVVVFIPTSIAFLVGLKFYKNINWTS